MVLVGKTLGKQEHTVACWAARAVSSRTPLAVSRCFTVPPSDGLFEAISIYRHTLPRVILAFEDLKIYRVVTGKHSEPIERFIL